MTHLHLTLDMYRSLVILLFMLISEINAARILAIFPTPSISHQVVFRPLTQELARRGHELTILTPDPAFSKENTPPNLTEIDVHDVSYNLWRDALKDQTITFGKKENIYKQLNMWLPLIGKIVEAQMHEKEVKQLLNNTINSFDLVIIEECVKHYLIFSHIFKAPVILISSFGFIFGDEALIGAPEHIFLYPGLSQQRLFNLTFIEKLEEMYKYLWTQYKWRTEQAKQYERIQKVLGYDLSSVDLHNNIDMIFLNNHPVWNNNRPLPPNVVSIWGIHKKPEKDLPKDLQSYLDSSKNGVIYLSFGSNVPSFMLPIEKIQILVNVFSKLPYDVLFKWDQDELPAKSENIRIYKWLPQSDLLRHPNIKLFITQGGLQSTDEAINAEVPLIGMPMLGDQWYNVEMYEHHKIGIKLDFETFTENDLQSAIKAIIHDKSYRENIIRLRSIMSDQPESALSRAVWWTEYVLRHGGAKHLRSPAANMPAAAYYEIPLVLTLAAIAIIVSVSLTYLLFSLKSVIVSKDKVKKS